MFTLLATLALVEVVFLLLKESLQGFEAELQTYEGSDELQVNSGE